MSSRPSLALLGGTPRFADGLPFVRPPAPPRDEVFARLASSYDAGMLTNGALVRELEDNTRARLGTTHAVAVSSCTIGLMLVLRCLEYLGRLEGGGRDVLLPSFTFSASTHAVAWNARGCRFVECDPESFQIDLDDAKAHLDGVGAIMATHVFGSPCRPEDVEALGASAGIPVLFDAAHGFGARRGDRPLGGFGVAEVFSLTPTKPVVAGEGGIVATDDDELAAALKIGRDYGNPGDYDTRFVGLNGRMSELHATVALSSLAAFDDHLVRRGEMADRYRAGFAGVAGITVQAVDPNDRSTYKDFTIAVDTATFGLTRDELVAVLKADGIDTRNYFDPPVHRQQSHAADGARHALPITDAASARVVSLPIYPALSDADIDGVVEVIATAGASGDAVRSALATR